MSYPSSTNWRTRTNQGWTYVDRIDPAAEGWTCLQFYTRRYSHSNAAQWLQRLQAGQMRQGAHVLAPDSVLAAGDRLSYDRPPWTEPAAPRWFAVLHQDQDLLAVAKPAGLQVLPAAGFLQNTLLDVIREKRGPQWAPAHRLGRGTSGVVLFARSDEARRHLAEAFRTDGLRKTYRALVQGHDVPDSFTVDTPIGKIQYPGMGHVFAADPRAGKPSRSHVRCLQRRGDVSLVEVEIPTGRPHQIRIHLAAAGFPLVGDQLYDKGGLPRVTSGTTQRRPRPGDMGYHLHAMSVTCRHPVSAQDVAIFCRPPPMLRIAASTGV